MDLFFEMSEWQVDRRKPTSQNPPPRMAVILLSIRSGETKKDIISHRDYVSPVGQFELDRRSFNQ
jgi:hypothetical protein